VVAQGERLNRLRERVRMKQSLHVLARLGLVLLLAVMAGACGAGSNKPGASAPGATKAAATPQPVTLRIGLASAGLAIYTPVQYAKDKGLDKKYGVNLDITTYQGGGPEQEALAGGDADIIHYFPVGVATAVKKGIKEKIIATDQYRPSGWYFMVNAKSSFNSIQDLNGKKIGITSKNTTSDYFVLWIANKYGIKFQEVPVGSNAYPALLTGNIDAAILSPPLSFQGVRSGDMRMLLDLGQEMPPTLPDVIVASQAIIDKHPEAVKGYLNAIFEANRDLKANHDQAVPYLVQYTKANPADAEDSWSKVVKDLSDDGTIQQQWLQNSLDLAKPGGITDLPPIDQFFTSQFTPAK
jgi:NitT/TauT family transport system substrate-binding protein